MEQCPWVVLSNVLKKLPSVIWYGRWRGNSPLRSKYKFYHLPIPYPHWPAALRRDRPHLIKLPVSKECEKTPRNNFDDDATRSLSTWTILRYILGGTRFDVFEWFRLVAALLGEGRRTTLIRKRGLHKQWLIRLFDLTNPIAHTMIHTPLWSYQ